MKKERWRYEKIYYKRPLWNDRMYYYCPTFFGNEERLIKPARLKTVAEKYVTIFETIECLGANE